MVVDAGEDGCGASETGEMGLRVLGRVEEEHPTWVASSSADTRAALFVGIVLLTLAFRDRRVT